MVQLLRDNTQAASTVEVRSLVIIPCGGKKQPERCRAVEMYTGPYFKGCLMYAYSLVHEQYENIFILSAKYGLLDLNQEIETYNLKMGQPGCVNWRQVKKQAEERGILEVPQVTALGGELYTQVVKWVWGSGRVKTPLAGVGGIGKQLQWLKNHR